MSLRQKMLLTKGICTTGFIFSIIAQAQVMPSTLLCCSGEQWKSSRQQSLCSNGSQLCRLQLESALKERAAMGSHLRYTLEKEQHSQKVAAEKAHLEAERLRKAQDVAVAQFQLQQIAMKQRDRCNSYFARRFEQAPSMSFNKCAYFRALESSQAEP